MSSFFNYFIKPTQSDTPSDTQIKSYFSKPYSYSIPSVYALDIWKPIYPNLHQSNVKLQKRNNDNGPKILIQYADYNLAGNKMVQGDNNNYFYNFLHWQYIDIFAYVGQGLFTIPTPGYINIAHYNGVKIIGALMAPVYQEQYTPQFGLLFTKKGKTYPYADKLAAVMKYFGFDGWFFNIEESLPENIKWEDVQGFLIYLNAQCKKINDDSEIHWYDSNYIFGSGSYDEKLDNNNVKMFQSENDIVSDGFFIDYSWTDASLSTSISTALSVKRNKYDIYAGVYAAGSANPIEITDAVKHALKCGVSVGLWGMNYILENSSSPIEFETNRSALWSKLSTCITPKTISCSLPWKTNFCHGTGYAFFVNGNKVSNDPWGNMSAQDNQMCWDINTSHGPVKVYYDHSVAYNMSNSLCFLCGEHIPPTIVDLYEVDFTIGSKGCYLNVVYQMSDGIDFDIILYEDNDGYNPLVSSSDKQIVKNGDNIWNSRRYELYGITIKKLSICLTGNTTDKLNIGEISLIPLNTQQEQGIITNINASDYDWVIDIFGKISLTFSLDWEDDGSNRYYDIYYKRPDFGEFKWYRRSYSKAYRFTDVTIKGDILWTNTTFTYNIIPYNYGGVQGETKSIDIKWEPPECYLSDIKRMPN
jgi:endo-beta-N-acetylglucosaminidase D